MKALDPLAVPLGDTTLIEASAGTGKTWTLATLYLRLLVEARLEVGQILVVTYTNAATAELRDRIRSRVREAVTVFEQAAAGTPPDAEPLASLVRRCRDAGTLDATVKHLRNALRGFDEAAIFTIHGFCQRILLENAFESGVAFDAELVIGSMHPVARELSRVMRMKKPLMSFFGPSAQLILYGPENLSFPLVNYLFQQGMRIPLDRIREEPEKKDRKALKEKKKEHKERKA